MQDAVKSTQDRSEKSEQANPGGRTRRPGCSHLPQTRRALGSAGQGSDIRGDHETLHSSVRTNERKPQRALS